MAAVNETTGLQKHKKFVSKTTEKASSDVEKVTSELEKIDLVGANANAARANESLTFCTFFDYADAYFEKRKEIDAVLKEAFFDLLQARNAMGAAEITPLKYDYSRMQALTRINVDEVDSELSSKEDRIGCADEDKEETTETIRHLSFSSYPTNAASDKKLDPLRWYGVFLPPYLKTVQKRFRKAYELILELATMRSKIDGLEKLHSSRDV